MRKACKTPDVIHVRPLEIDINAQKYTPFVVQVRENQSLLMEPLHAPWKCTLLAKWHWEISVRVLFVSTHQD